MGQFLRAQLLIVSPQLQQSGAYYLVTCEKWNYSLLPDKMLCNVLEQPQQGKTFKFALKFRMNFASQWHFLLVNCKKRIQNAFPSYLVAVKGLALNSRKLHQKHINPIMVNIEIQSILNIFQYR